MTVQHPGEYLVDMEELVRVRAASVADAVELAKISLGDLDNTSVRVPDVWRLVGDDWELVQ